MNDLERNFIEGAARALFVTAWADQQDSTCDETVIRTNENLHGMEHKERCGIEQDGHDQREPEHVFSPRSFSGQDIAEVAPETPDYVRLEAARLLGKVEQANGMGIAAIMAAAARADRVQNCARDSNGLDICYAAPTTVCAHHPAYADSQLADDEQEQFGWFVAMEATGTGVSWFDDHAEVVLPWDGPCGSLRERGCSHPAHEPGRCDEIVTSRGGTVSHHCDCQLSGRRLRVPSFEFTRFNLED